MGSVKKICVDCNTDVANKKRVKDAQGHYFCQSCYDARIAQKRPAEPATVSAARAPKPAAAVADPYDFPPEPQEIGDIGLADEVNPPAAAEAASPDMFGCADCKKLVNAKQIRNDDGDFVCSPCFSKRRQKAAPVREQSRKSFAEEEGVSTEPAFKDTILGGVLITGGVTALGFGMMMGLHLGFPDKHAINSPLITLVTSGLETVLMLLQAGSLIISMFIAARILGGCEFGTLGGALWKSMSIVAGFHAFNFFVEHNESFGMLGLMFRGILLVITFIVVFRLDYFEAMLLSLINFFVFIGLGILMAIAVTQAVHFMRPPENLDEDTPGFQQPAPGADLKPVAPAAPGDNTTAPADTNPAPAQ
ncbi:MAG TPA: hypothetical protein VM008_10385 [Phycisphaerae bacterium]|nr:hypothetical protein [Phycisphaerae bacterium]